MWKNRFSFGVFGRDGYARVDGLGGSYGVESLTVGHKSTEGSVPDETVTNYEEADQSWEADWHDLVTSIEKGRDPEVGGDGALAVMRLVNEVYARAVATENATPGVSFTR
jgi:predicted dehydrogenase